MQHDFEKLMGQSISYIGVSVGAVHSIVPEELWYFHSGILMPLPIWDRCVIMLGDYSEH